MAEEKMDRRETYSYRIGEKRSRRGREGEALP
jgi:hypothetical protein